MIPRCERPPSRHPNPVIAALRDSRRRYAFLKMKADGRIVCVWVQSGGDGLACVVPFGEERLREEQRQQDTWGNAFHRRCPVLMLLRASELSIVLRVNDRRLRVNHRTSQTSARLLTLPVLQRT